MLVLKLYPDDRARIGQDITITVLRGRDYIFADTPF